MIITVNLNDEAVLQRHKVNNIDSYNVLFSEMHP